MKVEIYSVFDNVAKVWTQPIYQINEGVARRNIAAAVNTKDHNYNVAPGDYELWRIGIFDDQSGEIEPCNFKVANLAAFYKEDN